MDMITIEELLIRACPSIQYRIRAEILNEPPKSYIMQGLQNQILEDTTVQEIFSWQQSDGWLGTGFHSDRGMETSIRLLREKGVNQAYPVIQNALNALSNDDHRLSQGIGKVGKILDERNLGGTEMIRATVFAYAKAENHPIVQEQICAALEAFQAVIPVQSRDDISTTYKDKLVFLPTIVWPSIYHMRLLAFTHNWRSDQNQTIIARAIQNLVNLSPIPYILVRHKSQLIAPASFCMLNFNPKMDIMDDSEWMMWFHRMELLARLGVVKKIPELEHQASILKETLRENQGKFIKKLSHSYFRNWGPYSGLMLENNWRDPKRRMIDLTFRSLLILHYSLL